MPIYEFACADCDKRFSVLMGISEDAGRLRCPACKGHRLKRLFSRFAAPKSEEARIERMADPAKWGGVDDKDPKSLVRFMKKMGREFGEDLGEDFDHILEEAGETAADRAKGGGDDTLYSPGEL